MIISPIKYVDATIFYSGMRESDCKGVIAINVGDVIIWENNEDQPRKVVSVDKSDQPNGLMQSDLINHGEIYIHRFSETGNYEYYCMKPHAEHGFIHVVSEKIHSKESNSSFIEYKTPPWFEVLLEWHHQKQISKNDLLNAIKFLIEKKTIVEM